MEVIQYESLAVSSDLGALVKEHPARLTSGAP